MSDNSVPNEILVITGPARLDDRDLELRRDPIMPRLPNVETIKIGNLHGQVNVFLNQLNQVMVETPEKVGSFRLTEFEVSAGIVVEAKGGTPHFVQRMSGTVQGTPGYLDEVIRDMTRSRNPMARQTGRRLANARGNKELDYLIAVTRWVRDSDRTAWTVVRRAASGSPQ